MRTDTARRFALFALTVCVTSSSMFACRSSTPAAVASPSIDTRELVVPTRKLAFTRGLPPTVVHLPTRFHEPVDVSQQAEQAREEGIADIKRALPRARGPSADELVLRLALLYLDEATARRALAARLDDDDDARRQALTEEAARLDEQGQKNLVFVWQRNPRVVVESGLTVECAIALVERGEPAAAVAILEQVRPHVHDDARVAAVILGDMNFALDEHARARALYEEACATPGDDDVCRYVATRMAQLEVAGAAR